MKGSHQEQPIRGAFSVEKLVRVGFGATKRTNKIEVMVYAEQEGNGDITLWKLNKSHIPFEKYDKVSFENLMADYSPEPAFYQEKIYPAMRKVAQGIARGERLRVNGQPYGAEVEFLQVLEMDEDNVRATFGLGLTYLDRNEISKGQAVFSKLVGIEATFAPEHKHMFNEFGIKLRKNKMYEQALQFYSRAQKLSALDEHLLYNIGRVLIEIKEYKKALVMLAKALEVNPEFAEAKKVFELLDRKMNNAA
ncbi:tetratricopeptide repeat protein [Halodesulfovibrio marinisediminis]|uniref:TPR repeat-containing protein n=1 Tax=Halodesulfovibrio marinisediminis DSM 17456 TaxID=1121457 RepID=A0A1N6HKH2_9BACT|nr:tetratricopeptide repeat protein [Halodesulfovibrio marinisediminis]SIO20169.1 TPR repeat-containing protein [Halodesulfovibrio marinisediminis DSM 17456]